MTEDNKHECPCMIATSPCHPDCTCVNPFSSSGCYCCARYGSEKQRKKAADKIVKAMNNVLQWDQLEVVLDTRSATSRELVITNQEIITEYGDSFDCTLKNAHRFAGCELDELIVIENMYEPKAEEFDAVVEYLKTRKRKPARDSKDT